LTIFSHNLLHSERLILDESQLISSLQQHSESAFRELVSAFQDRVYNTCLGLLQNDEDAEECAQDVFIEVHRSIHKFRGDAKLSTWIYRIATTKALELIRKQKRQKRFAFLRSLTTKEGDDLPVASFDHPGVTLENKENAQALFKAIEKLPDSQRVAFTLHKVEGLPYQEICEIMDTSLGSVESLIFRARKNLQKILRSYYEKNFKS
jgi:RNA polymerase sigma-70 factor (ECF subfamily)